MRLDGKLTARQLWKIASDKERRTPELLDAIMGHPSTYLTLFRWAMYAQNEPDATKVLDPPEPKLEDNEPHFYGYQFDPINDYPPLDIEKCKSQFMPELFNEDFGWFWYPVPRWVVLILLVMLVSALVALAVVLM